MAFFATGDQFSNEIISQFLYGEKSTPANVADEKFIGRSNNPSVGITASQFMAGPGRFARPEFFEAVQRFFDIPLGELLDLIEDFATRNPALGISFNRFGRTALSKDTFFEFLEDAFGSENFGLVFNQGYFDDEQDDYFQRTFIWGTTSFKISDEATFVIDVAVPELRFIEDFAIVPNGDENFDFEGGDLSSVGNVIAEPLVNPFGIGVKVDIPITGSGNIARTTYTFDQFITDRNSSPRSVGFSNFDSGTRGGTLKNLIDDGASSARLLSQFPDYLQGLYNRGVIDYRQASRDVFFGTDGSDQIQVTDTSPFQAPQAIASGVAIGGYVIAGDGDDTLNGSFGRDILVGGSGRDSFFGGLGDDRFVIDRDDALVDGGIGTDTVEYAPSDPQAPAPSRIEFRISEVDEVIRTGLPLIPEIPTGRKTLRVSAQSGSNTTSFISIERLSGTERADNIVINSLAPINNTDLVIDLRGTSEDPGVADTVFLEGYSSNGEITVDLRPTVQSVTDSEGGKGLRFQGVEAVRGSSGVDKIYASNSGDDIRGGGGEDELFGGAVNDRIVGALETDVGAEFDDLAPDTLTGGGGSDQFYAGDGDTITDPEPNDRIYLRGQLLTGGTEEEENTGVYESADGGEFRLADDGTLTFELNPTITIENFRNRDAGIRLIDKEPDDDRAEELRDPLIIDLDGDQNVLTKLSDSTAYFDLDNDGFAERVAWAGRSDGFLVRDLNGDGAINNGTEMFGTGNVALEAGRFEEFGEEGFAELALLDSDLDGAITAADVQFAELRVWIDANGDALTDEGELVTLESLGIVSISLSTFDSDHIAIIDDASLITRASTVGFDDGSTGTVYDAYLAINQYDAREILGDVTIDESIAELPLLLGTGSLSDLDVAMSRDARLEEMVRSLSNLEIGDAHEILDRTQAILLRWTGADRVSPDSRGPNINGQWLRAIERITGSAFDQAVIGANPRADAASILIDEWKKIVTRTAAKLVGQTGLTDVLTPGLAFEAAAFFVADEGTTLQSVLDNFQANAPVEGAKKVSYWAGAIALLDQYRTALGETGPSLNQAIDAALAQNGVGFTADELRSAIVVSEGENFATGKDAWLFIDNSDDLFLINGSSDRVDGLGGNDRYVVGKDAGSIRLFDKSGGDALYLLDHNAADLQANVIRSEGRVWLKVQDNEGRLDVRVRLEISSSEVTPDVETVFFADGTSADLLALVQSVDLGSGILLGGQSPNIIEGTAENELLVGLGDDNTYAFGAGSGNDLISDARGGNDQVIIDAAISDVAFIAERNGEFDDLVIQINATGETLRIIGQRSNVAKTIEQFVFNDGTLTLAEIDQRLNIGSEGDDVIFGSIRPDRIEGLGGDDDLRGGGGQDIYRLESGWGSDRVLDPSSANIVSFGDGISVNDISAERGANGDLVLRSNAGDELTIVGGLRSPIVASFEFADGSAKTLLDFISELGDGQTNVIAGTAIDEELVGTDASETFVGGGGVDRLVGNGGSDTFQPGEEFTRIFAGSSGIDTLLAPSGFDIQDLRFDDNNSFAIRFGKDGPGVLANAGLDLIQFEDGQIIGLGDASLAAGTDGDDFLYHTGDAPAVFAPGAGNDVMIGSTEESGRDIYELSVGFGQDIIYDLGGSNDLVRFLSPELSVANAEFDRVDSDLVISFASGDTLTVEGFYWNHPYESRNRFFGLNTGVIESFRFGDGQVLSFDGINAEVSTQTDGDDWVITGAGTERDGGLGNDILVGGTGRNEYIFAVGYGHDLIKDDGTLSFGTDFRDSIAFVGLEAEDVSISLDADDPMSVVFTIIATGETLTVDGSPDDGFLPDWDFRSSRRDRGYWIESVEFESTSLSRDDVLAAAFASSATDGDDVFFTLNSSADIDGGLGNDFIDIAYGEETVIIGPDSGHDIVSFERDGSRSGFGGSSFGIEFQGFASEDLIFVEVNEVDGQIGRHLRIFAGDSSVTILNGLDARFSQFFDEVGVQSRFNIRTTEPNTGNSSLTQGTAGDDILRADGDPNAPGGGELFDPGAGDDLILGSPGQDRVLFDVGYGVDRYELRGGSLTVEMADGIAASDIALTWSQDEPGQIELSIIGTDDKLIFDPRALSEILVGGEVISTSPVDDLDPTTLPTSTVDPTEQITTQPGDELVVATDGSATIVVGSESGSDFIQDARFDSALDGTTDLSGWNPNDVVLDGVLDISELRFVIDNDKPNDLIIEKPNGDRVTILNQFGFGIPQIVDGYISPDLDGDGTPDWQSIDLDGNGTPDFDPLDANGDGAPDWLAADFDGDGQSDWVDYAFADTTFNSGEVFAEDSDLDGNFDLYFFDTADSFFTARDIDGDGIADEYSEDELVWTAAPTNGSGEADWSLLDLDGNGVSDLQGFADGVGPTWLSGWTPATGDPRWSVSGFGELEDADGNFIAEREFDLATGASTYFVYGDQGIVLPPGDDDGGIIIIGPGDEPPVRSSTDFVAQDIDGDGVADLVGIDEDGDGEPDSALDASVRTVVSSVILEDSRSPFGVRTIVSLSEIIPLIEFVTPPSVTVVDLEALKPVATDGADNLLLGTGEELDSLAGDDVIVSYGDGGTFRWSAGDGNDRFQSTLRFPAGAFEIGAAGSTLLDTIQLDGIIDPDQLRYFASADNASDLVIEIIETGERLTVAGQLGAPNALSEAAPPVGRFVFEGGLELSAGEVALRVQGQVSVDENVQITNGSGGLLDAGAGGDDEDMLLGGTGDDIYRFGRDYAEDTIMDAGGFDTVQFGENITANDVFFSRTGENGEDLLVEVLGLDRLTLTISGQFADESSRIESFAFEDGSRLDWRAVQQIILDRAETLSDDTIVGFDSDDILRGGKGNDSLTAAGGNDELFGGEGRDQAVFTGSRDEYTVTEVDGVTTVTDSVAGRDGTNRLESIEDLVFLGDGSTTLLQPANSAPEASDLQVEVDEDGTLTIDRAAVLAAGTDADGDVLQLGELSDVENGQAWVGEDGNLRFRPDRDFAGAAGFTFALLDGNGGVATARVGVTVNPINDAPVIAIDAREFSTIEDTPIAWTLPDGAIVDADGDALSVSAMLADGSDLPDWLSFDGQSFTGTPPQDFNGVLDIELIADDGTVATSAPLRITIEAINDAPVVASDPEDVTLRPGEAFAFTVAGDTFSDVDGDALTFEILTGDGGELPDWIAADGLEVSGTVPDDFDQPLELVVIADDGRAASAAAFSLLPFVNTAPELAVPIGPVSSDEDTPVSFTIPAGTFADADGDELVLSATLSDGSDLPAWLSFDGTTFTGVPPTDFNGVLAIQVSASDGEAGVSDTFDLTITAVNDAPVVVTPLSDVSSNEDAPFAFAIDPASFADVDGDPLSLSATLADGSDLPDWISFDGTSFTGTPPQDFSGSLELSVIASDGELTTADTFTLTIDPLNDPPVILEPIADQVSAEDAAFSFAIPDGTFADVDGDTLMLSASLTDGGDLPAWLSFDGVAFTGTPPQDFNGFIDLAVTASDGEVSVTDGFRLTIDPVNDAPFVVEPLADQQGVGGSSIQFAVPSSSFADVDGDTLSYSASLADGSALPDWLIFDDAALTFAGTAPNADATLDIRVTASDGSLAVSDDFLLTVDAVNTGGGSSAGFEFFSLNSWYNPAWGGGYNVTFEYTVQPEAIIDGELKAWDILAEYTGPGTIVNGWLNGFNGPASFEAVDGGALFSTVSQGFQPDLEVGDTFQISIQVDGAPYAAGDFGFEIFDRDPATNLADNADTLLTISPTNSWGTGLTQNVSFTNIGDTQIDDWSLMLDAPEGIDFNITNVWNATATVLASGDILFEALSYNEEVAPNASAGFGFNASYSGGGTVQFTAEDFSFTDNEGQSFASAQEVATVSVRLDSLEGHNANLSRVGDHLSGFADIGDGGSQTITVIDASLSYQAAMSLGVSRVIDPVELGGGSSSEFVGWRPQSGVAALPGRDEVFDYLRSSAAGSSSDLFDLFDGTQAHRAHVMPSTRALASDVAEPAFDGVGDAELARKLALLRQDISAFGAGTSVEAERLHADNPEHFQLYV